MCMEQLFGMHVGLSRKRTSAEVLDYLLLQKELEAWTLEDREVQEKVTALLNKVDNKTKRENWSSRLFLLYLLCALERQGKSFVKQQVQAGAGGKEGQDMRT